MQLIPYRELTVPASSVSRIQHGMYSMTPPTGPRNDHYLRAMAAVQRRKSPHVASHITAAVLHGLPLFNEDLDVVHLTSPRPSRRGLRAKIKVHEGPVDDTVPVGGVLVTSLPRTLIDCARTLPRDQAVAMTDFALHSSMTTKEELLELLNQLGGWRTQQVRNVINLADARAESVGESRTRLILIDAGYDVDLQVDVRDNEGYIVARIDIVIGGTRVGVEFEGREKADKVGDSGRSNKERNDNVEAHDWIIVPVYWDHLKWPQVVLALVRRGLQRAQTMAA